MKELDLSELHRKKLHSYIQELRGNIRIYCRVKPIINSCEYETYENLQSCLRYPEYVNQIDANKAAFNSIEIINPFSIFLSCN